MENMISKNFKKFGFLAGAFALLLGSFPVGAVHADTTQSQANVNQQIQNFQSEVNIKLSQVNDLYAKANKAQDQVNATQANIDDLQVKIAQSQKDEASLRASVSEQMRSIQSNGGVTISVLGIITSSGNLSNMIQRLTNLNTVLDAETAQVKELQDTQTSLKKMTKSLEQSKIELVKNQQSYQSQVGELQGNISTLQNQINSNKQLLTQMQAQAAAAQAARQAKMAKDAQAAQDAAAKAQAQKTASSGNSQNQNNNSTTSTTPQKPVSPVLPPTSSGKTMNVLATAYSWQNVGYITATGIDLRTNPMCIAVDPSVIPLGSLVEVPGYGVAIAGDTGGAIIGYHIDVHFPTVAQAVTWGAQHVQIRILS